MAKRVGFEVVATRPVCVDFRDGRTVSYRPGQRFKAALTNTSVARLLRISEVRKLGPYEAVPPMPIKLGAPRRVQSIMKTRSKIEQAKKAARAKMEASRMAPPKIELAKPAPKKKAPPKPKAAPKPNSTPSKSDETENK